MDRLDCDECQEFWAGERERPPCHGCHPGVHAYNRTAYDLWPLVGRQLIWVNARERAVPVAVRLGAIESAIRIAEIAREDRLLVTQQLLYLGDMVCEWARQGKGT
jgi:hypothetical protein